MLVIIKYCRWWPTPGTTCSLRLAFFWSEDKDKGKEKDKDNNKWSTTRGFSIEHVKSVLNWRKQSQSGQLQRRGTRKGVTESHTQQDVGSTTYLSAQVELLKWNSGTQLAFVGIPIVEITFGWKQVSRKLWLLYQILDRKDSWSWTTWCKFMLCHFSLCLLSLTALVVNKAVLIKC